MNDVQLSSHAKRRAKEEGIPEEDIIECVLYGKRKHIEERDGEVRYAHVLPTKYGVIMVVWTKKNGKKWVITAYMVRRIWKK